MDLNEKELIANLSKYDARERADLLSRKAEWDNALHLAAKLSNAVLAAKAVQHDPDLVFRREMAPRRAPDILRYPFSGRRLMGQGF